MCSRGVQDGASLTSNKVLSVANSRANSSPSDISHISRSIKKKRKPIINKSLVIQSWDPPISSLILPIWSLKDFTSGQPKGASTSSPTAFQRSTRPPRVVPTISFLIVGASLGSRVHRWHALGLFSPCYWSMLQSSVWPLKVDWNSIFSPTQ